MNATNQEKTTDFINVPKLVRENKIKEVFPNLNPNVYNIRANDFPLFDKLGRIYLDSTATSQEPKSVKDKIHEYKTTHIRGSNHSKNSEEARESHKQYENARQNISSFFGANNYVMGFTSGSTETSNWLGMHFPLNEGDNLILTEMEHNSQILTARHIAKKNGVNVYYVPVNKKDGSLNLDTLQEIVKKQKKGNIIMNLVHVSNFTGIINPVEKIREILGDRGFLYLDMAQSAGHIPINLDKLDVDFAGVSSHKMCGPMGMGAIFINNRSKRHIQNDISGGSAVKMVSKTFESPVDFPANIEPGTQNIEGAIEWSYAVDFLKNISMQKIELHDRELAKYFSGELSKIKSIRQYGPSDFNMRTGILPFNIGCFIRKNYDDVANYLDTKGISVRDGCFCTHIYTAKMIGLPRIVHEGRTLLLNAGISDKLLKLPGTVRASFAFYNTIEEAHKVVNAIREYAK
ncbi:MAG: aminotransferase class V-fold PLP-dependent enzyme [Candidatus Woesearchaeota archaeon]|jgi:cysteine desulfurase/selenocysteine lyase